MANNFATKLHIDNRRLSALWGSLLCQTPKVRELWPQNEGLDWVNIWHPIVKFGTQLIYLELWEIQSWNSHTYTFRQGQVLFPGMKFFSPRGCSGGRSSVNLGPPHISETTRARKLKFYTHLDETKYFFRYENFYARGVRWAQHP